MESRRNILRKALWIVCGAAFIWLFAVFLLPLTLPFLLAFGLAALTAPAAEKLMARSGMSRRMAGGLCVAAVYLLCSAVLFFLCRILARQSAGLFAELPETAARLGELLGEAEIRLELLSDRLPNGMGEGISERIAEFFRSGAGLAEELPARALKLASNTAKALPDVALASVTTLAAGFMASSRLPKLRDFLRRRVPESFRRRIGTVFQRVHTALGGWLKAQIRLMGITFLILTSGLTFLRVRYGLLLALLISLVDALPVLGVGTVLLPWATVLLLRGEPVRAAAIAALWLITLLVRTLAEPRLMGRQMGLDPLLTLAAVYIGFRLCGIGGMILFPMGAAVVRQFFPPTQEA